MQRNRREAAEGSNTVKAMQETETAAILSASETALRLIGYFMPVIGLIMAIIKTIRLKDPQKRTLAIASLLARPFILFIGCVAFTLFYIAVIVMSGYSAR